MAPRKATAKSPNPKSTPKRQAEPEVVEVSSDASSNYDDVPDLDDEAAQGDLGSGDDSGPEPEAATTPARKGGKRKAADEEDDGGSPGAKKPKVSSVTFSESVTESGGGKGKKKHAHKNVKVEIPVSTTPVPKPAAGKHIVFNDDDGPAEFFTPQEAPAQELLDAQLSAAGGAGGDDEGSDSDDDAPEAVSSHAAAAQAAKSAQAATKAAEKQLELQKRRRQERDARLKQQAETRKKNQAVSDKKAAKAAAAAATAEGSPEPAPGRRDHLPSVSTAPTRKRLDRRSLPDVLPDDFLEAASDDDDEDRQDDDEDEAASRRQKKPHPNTIAKQLARAESRRPQDQRVGSTVYRVTAPQGDSRLAPKMSKHSRNAKELLMRRGRPVARRGGFLVKKRS